MNRVSINQSLEIHDPTCADLMKMAELELAAFVGAVTDLFGPGQAELSAEEWLHELAAVNDLPASTREWRLISVKVSARLAYATAAVTTDEVVDSISSL